MISTNPTWQLVKEKREELKSLVDRNWQNGEYHIAAIGERTLRTVNGSIETSEHAIDVTNHFIGSVNKLQHLIVKYNASIQ